MPDPFDYDVFLSFASGDETLVKPIWQELCLSGLRVFWSNSTLKERLGESWFDNVESALERSRHFILIASEAGMASEWVRREYKAFFSHCYKSGVRRLFPIVTPSFEIERLPLLLRDLLRGARRAHVRTADTLPRPVRGEFPIRAATERTPSLR